MKRAVFESLYQVGERADQATMILGQSGLKFLIGHGTLLSGLLCWHMVDLPKRYAAAVGRAVSGEGVQHSAISRSRSEGLQRSHSV
jgi:hypothetical protein